MGVVGLLAFDSGKSSGIEEHFVETDAAGIGADIVFVDRLQAIAAWRFVALLMHTRYSTETRSSSSFYLNQATWPIHKRQTDRISKRIIIKHSKSHKSAEGLAHRSSFTKSLLCLHQTYRKDFL